MLWSYVKQNLIDLGFEEAGYLNDPAALSIFCTATNKARRIISQVKPVKYNYTIEQKLLGVTETVLTEGEDDNEITIDGNTVYAEAGNSAVYDNITFTFNGVSWTAKPLITYDLVTLTAGTGYPSYDRLDDVKTVGTDGELITFADYDMLQNRYFVPAKNAGTILIFYSIKLDDITPDTPDDFDIQIDYEIEHLVPLLAGHYAWLDDDIQKATMYYNEYEQLLNQVTVRLQERENEKTKMKVVGGFKWH